MPSVSGRFRTLSVLIPRLQSLIPQPIHLIARCLKPSTNKADLVLDPFDGLGSTGVAALELGRSFIGVELDPEYLALAARRIQAAQGAR